MNSYYAYIISWILLFSGCVPYSDGTNDSGNYDNTNNTVFGNKDDTNQNNAYDQDPSEIGDHQENHLGDNDYVAPDDDPNPFCLIDTTTGYLDVSIDDLYQRIQDQEHLAIVDVREPDETATGIIEDALIYPWASGVLAAEHDTLPIDTPLYIICRSGSRSRAASQFLVDNDHDCIHNVLGGMNAWNAADYATVMP